MWVVKYTLCDTVSIAWFAKTIPPPPPFKIKNLKKISTPLLTLPLTISNKYITTFCPFLAIYSVRILFVLFR